MFYEVDKDSHKFCHPSRRRDPEWDAETLRLRREGSAVGGMEQQQIPPSASDLSMNINSEAADGGMTKFTLVAASSDTVY